MANNFKSILEDATGIEIASPRDLSVTYDAYIRLATTSEVDFAIDRKNYDFADIPINNDDDVLVMLKTKECCYSYKEKCTFVRQGRFFTLSVRVPNNLERRQSREFVRIPLVADLLAFIVTKDEYKNRYLVKPHDIKSIDVSGGGLAYYDEMYIKPKTQVVIELSFASLSFKECRQTAEVLRCTPVEGKDLFRVAVRFVDMPFPIQDKINRFVFAEIRKSSKKVKTKSN